MIANVTISFIPPWWMLGTCLPGPQEWDPRPGNFYDCQCCILLHTPLMNVRISLMNDILININGYKENAALPVIWVARWGDLIPINDTESRMRGMGKSKKNKNLRNSGGPSSLPCSNVNVGGSIKEGKNSWPHPSARGVRLAVLDFFVTPSNLDIASRHAKQVFLCLVTFSCSSRSPPSFSSCFVVVS